MEKQYHYYTSFLCDDPTTLPETVIATNCGVRHPDYQYHTTADAFLSLKSAALRLKCAVVILGNVGLGHFEFVQAVKVV